MAAVGTRPSISVVVVAHNSVSDLRRSLPALIDQLGPEDEVLVVDNGPDQSLRAELPILAPRARLVVAPGNVGFAAGANLGVAAAAGELIVLLNPDAVVQPGWSAAMREPWGGPWDGWMALITLGTGDTINTSGGVLHFTGLGWAGRVGHPVTDAPRGPSSVAFLSGACLAVPAALWRELGGFPAEYFMYCEDVDLSLRIRLRGGAVGVIPSAQVIHSYDFDKGVEKWRLLERNRWATLVRCYPLTLFVLLLPALLVSEGAIWVTALRGGWGRAKARAQVDVMRWLPRLIRERREIQRTRAIGAYDFSSWLTADLESPFLPVTPPTPVRLALRGYWWTVRLLLRVSPWGAAPQKEDIGALP